MYTYLQNIEKSTQQEIRFQLKAVFQFFKKSVYVKNTLVTMVERRLFLPDKSL